MARGPPRLSRASPAGQSETASFANALRKKSTWSRGGGDAVRPLGLLLVSGLRGFREANWDSGVFVRIIR